MEITRPHHESGLGIYAKSVPVIKDWDTAEGIAKEMIEWMDTTNGNFKGEFKKAFAMAHAQVVDHDHPYKLFVVDKELVVPASKVPKGKQNHVNTFFEAQAIFNCEILEAPDKVTRKVPQRKVTRDPKNKLQATVEMVMEDKQISNVIEVPEGCMSFPHRSERNMKRCYTVKVRYQWVGKNLLGMRKVETFEGWVEGLKAHIIQHECEHFDGKNIHFR